MSDSSSYEDIGDLCLGLSDVSLIGSTDSKYFLLFIKF